MAMAAKKNIMDLIKEIGKKPDFRTGFDKSGVWTYFYTYQSKGIKNVGSVTKDFWSWQALHYALDAYQQVQSWEESRKKAVWLRDLAEQLDIMFRWLRDQVKLGGFDKKHPHMARFVAPVLKEQEPGAPEVEAICERAVRKGIYRARKMFFVPLSKAAMAQSHELSKAELLSLENLKRFCRFMERAGRMAQEGTIDSTKSGDAPNISLIDEMEKVGLKSRMGQFGIKFDFTGKQLTVACNDRKAEVKKNKKGKITKYVFPDMLDGMRIGAIKSAITQAEAQAILDIKQVVDTTGFPKLGQFKGMFDMAAELYHSIRECQRQDLKAAEELANGNKDQLRASERCAKDVNKVAYTALTNMIRATAGARGLKGIGLAKQSVQASLLNMGKDATRPSSFTGVVLAEEFFEYILSLCPEEFQNTYDELEYCDAVDGEVVGFKDGLAMGHNIYTHETKPIPDGQYTVRVDGKRSWLESSIQERVEARIAEAFRPQLVLQTLGCENVEALKAAIDGAENVVLVTTPIMVNGKRVSDVLIADGKILCRFKTTTKSIGSKNDPIINGMYGRKTGRVAYSHPISYNKGEKEVFALVVVLDDVKTMLQQDIVKAVEEASVSEVFEATAVKKESSFQSAEAKSRLDSMMADMDEEEEQVKVEVPKAMQSKKVSLAGLLRNKSQQQNKGAARTPRFTDDMFE